VYKYKDNNLKTKYVKVSNLLQKVGIVQTTAQAKAIADMRKRAVGPKTRLRAALSTTFHRPAGVQFIISD
jgi:hypothetical protein